MLIVNVWYLELSIYFFRCMQEQRQVQGVFCLCILMPVIRGIHLLILHSCCHVSALSLSSHLFYFFTSQTGGSLIEGLCSYTWNEGI